MFRIFCLISCFSFSSQGSLSKPEIKDLILKGEKGAIECNKTFEQIRAKDKNFDYGLTFPNKKISLEVVKILSKFPGTPNPTKELMDRLVMTRSKGLDYKWLSKEMDKTLVCDPTTLNLTLTKLIRSSRTFSFSKSEKRQMGKVIVSQLRKEAEFPTHLGLLAPYVLIMDSLIEQRAISLSVESAKRRQELSDELTRGLAGLKEKEDILKEKISDKEYQTKNFINEVRENEPFRVKFLEFIESLSPAVF